MNSYRSRTFDEGITTLTVLLLLFILFALYAIGTDILKHLTVYKPAYDLAEQQEVPTKVIGCDKDLFNRYYCYLVSPKQNDPGNFNKQKVELTKVDGSWEIKEDQ